MSQFCAYTMLSGTIFRADSYDHRDHGYSRSTFYSAFPTDIEWRQYRRDCNNPFRKVPSLSELLGPPDYDLE